MAEEGVPGETVTPRLPRARKRRRRRREPDDDVDSVVSTIRLTKHVHEARVRLGKRRVNIVFIRPDRVVIRGMLAGQHPEWGPKRLNDAVDSWLVEYERRELKKFRSVAD